MNVTKQRTTTSDLRVFAAAAYAVAAMLILLPAVDILANMSTATPDPGAVRWRFGAAGLVTGGLILPVLGAFLTMVAAHAAGHRWTLRAVSVLSGMTALLLLAAAPFFVLDLLQLRGEVRPEMMRLYDLTWLRSVVGQLVLVVTLSILAIVGWRASRVHTASSANSIDRPAPLLTAAVR